MGRDSMVCWQRAYELASRGPDLPEHIYDDWASDRRGALEARFRDCVQRWSALLREHGQLDEAIIRLYSYWQIHPTDEDVLRPLLEILGKRERFQEAERCYANARIALERDGHQLDDRTNDAMELVRALTIKRLSVKEVQTPEEKGLYSQDA